MTARRNRRSSIILIALVLAMLAAGAAGGGAAGARTREASSPAASCPDAMLLGSLGAGETPFDGTFGEFDKLLTTNLTPYVTSFVGTTVGYPVPTFSKAMLKDSAPRELLRDSQDYLRFIRGAVSTLHAQIAGTARTCPQTRLVLFGYSAGALTVGDEYETLLATHTAASRAQLASIAAVVLLADPKYLHSDPSARAAAGGFIAGTKRERRHDGLLVRAPLLPGHSFGSAKAQAGKLLSYCNSEDPICQGRAELGHGTRAHSSYAKPGAPELADAAAYVARLLIVQQQIAQVPAIPTIGSTLAYTASSAVRNSELSVHFLDWGRATNERPEFAPVMLPPSIGPYRCVILDAPTTLSRREYAELTSYVAQSGGTVIALGEGDRSSGDVAAANATIGRLAKSLGSDIRVHADDTAPPGSFVARSIIPTPLTVGVAALVGSGAAAVTAAPSERLVSVGSSTLIAAQTIGNGRLVVAGDTDLFTDAAGEDFERADNDALAKNLCA